MSLEVLASFDGILERLDRLCDGTPSWRPAQNAVPYLCRLRKKLSLVEDRSNVNIIVALLGGTGVGKSSLVNALLGLDIAEVSPIRPTTRRATLYCSSGYSPAMLGLPTQGLVVEHVDSPILENIMIIDCPDPDSKEQENRDVLRAILPNCDVIINVTTQQKYKDFIVAEELKLASVGGSLLWVQTHADKDADIRDDWKRDLQKWFNNVDNIFFVDSCKALENQKKGLPPEGDFAKLIETLTCTLPRIGSEGIRRYHFLDIAQNALEKLQGQLQEPSKKLDELDSQIQEIRKEFVDKLTENRVKELKDDRHQWTKLIRDEVVSQWGISPFSLALQTFGRLDQIMMGSLLFRARSLTQLAVLGTLESAKKLGSLFSEQASKSIWAGVPTDVWTPEELRKKRMALDHAIKEAKLPEMSLENVNVQAHQASEQFLIVAEEQLTEVVQTVAKQNSRWYVRWFYESLLILWTVLLLALPLKNFFYDYMFKEYRNLFTEFVTRTDVSQQTQTVVPISTMKVKTNVLYPTYVYIVTFVWFILGAGGLVAWFSWRSIKGVNSHLETLSNKWTEKFSADMLLQEQQSEIDKARRFKAEISALLSDVSNDKKDLNAPVLSRRKDDLISHES